MPARDKARVVYFGGYAYDYVSVTACTMKETHAEAAVNCFVGVVIAP